jgi:N-acetylglucosaminyldiphosphoundecaprenol N-acetyl-beta-D-mannosaminyltransferase
MPCAVPNMTGAATLFSESFVMTNFYRPVVALFGLPIDAVNFKQACALLNQARQTRERCFLSTPNLNFVVQSLHDGAFRDSVCRSDLSVADGMPLVWTARLLGLPLSERVSGADIFLSLICSNVYAWRIFFFGGIQGAGQSSVLSLGTDAQYSVIPVGHIYPGFTTVLEMSRTDILECINATEPDLLVVSLGSAKGQEWITHNMDQLNVPVISHLGAVINFSAGTVGRAPIWMQISGLEWLWRIKEEPQLWRRYYKDGCALLRLFGTCLLPLAIANAYRRMIKNKNVSAQLRAHPSQTNTWCLSGTWQASNCEPLQQWLTQRMAQPSSMALDISALDYIDARVLALLLLLDTALRDRQLTLHMQGATPALMRLLRWQCAEHLLLKKA